MKALAKMLLLELTVKSGANAAWPFWCLGMSLLTILVGMAYQYLPRFPDIVLP